MKKLHLVLLVVGMTLLFGLALADEKAEKPSKSSTDSGAALKKAESKPAVEKGQEDSGKAPVAVFDKYAHNAGTIRQGTPLQYTFTIKNEGNEELKILKARGG